MTDDEQRDLTRDGATIAIMTGVLAPIGVIIWICEVVIIIKRWLRSPELRE